MGDSQSRRGAISPQRQHPLPNCNQASSSNQDFLGFWTFDICWEGYSQRSSPQKRHIAHLRGRTHCHPGNQAAGTREVIRCTAPGKSVLTKQLVALSCSDLRRAQNAGPTESAPLWNTREPEPEQLRPGKCMQPRAHLRQFPAKQPRA